jgi:hypothetical protein
MKSKNEVREGKRRKRKMRGREKKRTGPQMYTLEHHPIS